MVAARSNELARGIDLFWPRDITELLGRAHVLDPYGGTYKPHGHDFVPWFGQICAHKHIIHEPEKRGCIRWDIEVAKYELCYVHR